MYPSLAFAIYCSRSIRIYKRADIQLETIGDNKTCSYIVVHFNMVWAMFFICHCYWSIADPDSKFHVAHMRSIWFLLAPGGPHVGAMDDLAIKGIDWISIFGTDRSCCDTYMCHCTGTPPVQFQPLFQFFLFSNWYYNFQTHKYLFNCIFSELELSAMLTLVLTHWGRDKIAAILHTIFSDAFF